MMSRWGQRQVKKSKTHQTNLQNTRHILLRPFLGNFCARFPDFPSNQPTNLYKPSSPLQKKPKSPPQNPLNWILPSTPELKSFISPKTQAALTLIWKQEES